MSDSITKTTVLALTKNTIAIQNLAGWKYRVTNHRFVSELLPGVVVTISIGWYIHGWRATSKPHVKIDSKLYRQTYKAVFGEMPKAPLMLLHYQFIWREFGKNIHSRDFWEDRFEGFSDETGKDRLISDIPDYIEELIQDLQLYLLRNYDLENEVAFLASLPNTYVYNGHPMIHYIGYLTTQMMLGNREALQDYCTKSNVPDTVLSNQQAELEAFAKKMQNIPNLQDIKP